MSDNNYKRNPDDAAYFEYLNRSNWWRMSNYISPESAEALRNFKYRGGDNGYSYQACWSPLANYIVNTITPEWIAPNTITLTGFMFSLVPFLVLFGVWNITLENSPESVPRWYYALFGLCYLMYRLLDEMDGKQARKTGNSSVLGMLFDHGIDAFSVSLVVICNMKFFSCGDSALSLYMFSACITMFYMPMIEDYYVGGTFLGRCNPISDGAIFSVGFLFAIAIFGNGVVTFPVFAEDALWKGSSALRFIDCFMYFAFIIVVFNIAIAVNNCYNMEKQEGKGQEANWLTILAQVGMYLVMLQAVNSLAFTGAHPLIEQGQGQDWPVFWVMMLQALVMQHMSTHIMLYSATNKRYSPFDNRLFLFVVLQCILLNIFSEYLDIKQCVIALVCITGVCQFYYLINLVWELTKVLDIDCFTVKKKTEEKQSLLR